MPLPPIPTQAADKVNISRQPKPSLKKRPKRVEVEETEEVLEVAETLETDLNSPGGALSLTEITLEKMRTPAKGKKTALAQAIQTPKTSARVRKIPDDGIIRLFVLDTNVLMHDPSALFRF
jgi:PhoH-like ATPase